MKVTKITFIIIPALIIAACSTVKKSATSTAASTPAPTTSSTTTNSSTVPVPPTDSYLFTNTATGINIPGDNELIALRAQYKDLTLDQLKQGHFIYTGGACINCHGPKSIYEIDVTQWKNILEDMAQKATISDAEKDAVYKYVLSIKATQPK